MPSKQHYLIFDISNLLYRTFFVNKTEDNVTVAGLATHMALTTLNKYFKQFQPHKVVMAFDRPSWRKEYTQTEECVTKKLYKGNRRKKMTPKEKEKYAEFMTHLRDFESMMREHTSVICLAADGLEADDLVAGVAQIYASEENEITIVSSDKDLIQLLGYPNVTLIDPNSGKPRSLDDWDGDAELFMFEKCLRGDPGDHVQSALPRIKKTRIRKAYKDAFERANVMHETWKDPDGTEFVVRHLFKENQLLMDLRCQPDDIERKMVLTIVKEMAEPGNFSYFHFMKFLGKYELKKIAEQAELFANMLSR